PAPPPPPREAPGAAAPTPAEPPRGDALTRAATALARGAFDAPRLTLALLALLVAVSIGLASRLGVDTDSSKMLNPSLPFQVRAQAINAAFPAVKNTVLVVVRGSHADAVEAATAALAARLGADPAVERAFAPSADPFLVTHGLMYQPLDEMRATLSRLSQSANVLAALRAERTVEGFLASLDRAMLLAEGGGADPADLAPLMEGAAASFDSAAAGTPVPFDWTRAVSGADPIVTRVVTVEPMLDFDRLNPAKPALEAVAAAIAGLDPALARLVEVGVTGDPALRADELASVTATLPLSFGLSFLIVAGVLYLALGSLARMALALGSVLVTLVLTAGFAALGVGALNLISVAFVVLMVGLGIDFAIHLMAHLDEDRAKGAPPRAALLASMRSIGGALALSAATTAMAFLAFTTTDFVGMAQLGLIGGAGVVLAFLTALTLIPAAVALRPGLASGRGPLGVPRPGKGGARLGVALALGLGLAAAALAPQVRFDADPMALRDQQAASVQVYGWLAADPALAPLRLSVMVDDAAAAAATAEAAAALPGVERVLWLGDLVPGDQDAKLDELDLAYPSVLFAVEGEAVDLVDPPEGDIAERLAAFAHPAGARLAEALQRWRAAAGPGGADAMAEALFRFFPALIERLGMQLEAGPVAIADLPDGLVRRFRAGDGRLRVEIAATDPLVDPAARDAFVDAVAAAVPEAGGAPAQVSGAARAVGGAMLQATLLALAATAAAAAVALRSAPQVLAIVLPLLLAGAVTMAASALLDIPFNYANVIVLPLMIGIGVDTGIHLATRARAIGRQARSADGTGTRVFDTSTPRAALASALTTIGAFGTLALSDHRGTASMGVMLVIALSASVLMMFALTPPLVARFTKPSAASAR
ncbi:MAG: MMPL family transporter, partial [Pseudomonadota bacterium]